MHLSSRDLSVTDRAQDAPRNIQVERRPGKWTVEKQPSLGCGVKKLISSRSKWGVRDILVSEFVGFGWLCTYVAALGKAFPVWEGELD